jgi:hypothetical protein
VKSWRLPSSLVIYLFPLSISNLKLVGKKYLNGLFLGKNTTLNYYPLLFMFCFYYTHNANPSLHNSCHMSMHRTEDIHRRPVHHQQVIVLYRKWLLCCLQFEYIYWYKTGLINMWLSKGTEYDLIEEEKVC